MDPRVRFPPPPLGTVCDRRCLFLSPLQARGFRLSHRSLEHRALCRRVPPDARHGHPARCQGAAKPSLNSPSQRSVPILPWARAPWELASPREPAVDHAVGMHWLQGVRQTTDQGCRLIGGGREPGLQRCFGLCRQVRQPWLVKKWPHTEATCREFVSHACQHSAT